MVNLFLAGGRRKFLSENEYVGQRGAPRIPFFGTEFVSAYYSFNSELCYRYLQCSYSTCIAFCNRTCQNRPRVYSTTESSIKSFRGLGTGDIISTYSGAAATKVCTAGFVTENNITTLVVEPWTWTIFSPLYWMLRRHSYPGDHEAGGSMLGSHPLLL